MDDRIVDKDKRGYTLSEVVILDEYASEKRERTHRRPMFYCIDCRRWAEQHYLIQRLMFELGLSNA